MRDDELREFIRRTNDPALGRQLEYELVDGIWQPIRSRAVGAVNQACDSVGKPADPSKRRFLEGIGGLVGLCTVAGALFGAISAIEAGVQIHEHSEDEEKATERELRLRYGIRASFAKYIASKGYGAQDIRIAAPENVNVGEEAILTSIEAYREFRVLDLMANMKVLEKAVRYADEDDSSDGKVIALARLMADASFLGDADAALQYTRLVLEELGQVINEKVRIRALDVATTITLNTLNLEEFGTLRSFDLRNILKQWDSLVGPTVVDASAEDLYAKYGIESTGALQQVWLRKMEANASNEAMIPRVSEGDLRQLYFDQLLDKTLKLLPSQGSEVARDFFYSLHRLTFQAAATEQGLAQAKEFLDFYFGRTGRSLTSEALNQARIWIMTHFPGSTPWMVLLDIALEQDIEKKRLKFEQLIDPKHRFSNQVLVRAVVQVGTNLGWKRIALEAILGDFRLAQEARRLTINQAYTLIVCDREGGLSATAN